MRERAAVTPESNSEISLLIGTLEGAIVSLTPRQEKTTSTQELTSPHCVHRASSPRFLIQEKSSRSILTLKRKEQTLPLLRSRKMIEVDMRILQSRESRQRAEALPWSRKGSLELLTPNAK